MANPTPTADLKQLEQIARANGYWHHIQPFADEIARLREFLARLKDEIDPNKAPIIHAMIRGGISNAE